MNLLKSELKQMVTSEVGARVEDALEVAQRELFTLEAKKVAFHEGARAVEALMASVDKDIDEGKMDLPVAEIVKRYLSRSVNALQNMSQQAANFTVAQSGKVQGLQQTVSLLKAIVDDERKKLEQMRAAMVAEVSSPSDGARPPPTIKQQRLAEEAEALKAAEAAQEQPRVENS